MRDGFLRKLFWPSTQPAAADPAEQEPVALQVPADQVMAPNDLAVTDQAAGRVLGIGSCFLEALIEPLDESGTKIDFVLANGVADFPDQPPAEVTAYDYQVVQIPLRVIMHDDLFTHIGHDDIAAYEAAFHQACKDLEAQLRARLAWNTSHGLLTFVFNFMAPQYNAMGRFFPRYALSNPTHFVERLNQQLETLLGGYARAHLVDIDGLSASFGRRYVQDDTFTAFNHNAPFSPCHTCADRIEPLGRLKDYYQTAPGDLFGRAIAAELRAMMRTVRRIDPIKLVVLDLDDTLWNGVSGDMADIGPHMAEGWPIGVAEALAYVRKRGIILAICSKNDEARIREIWFSIFQHRLRLDDFAAIRINWRPKAENMQDILHGMNLLPGNVLFIDDNPAERAAMQAAFPDMRAIGGNPFHVRRILLQAAEMQTVTVTTESSRRTEMIRAQMERERARATVSVDDFAREQKTVVRLSSLASATHKRFSRAHELINKTNQFNTTGRRWQPQDCDAFFADGGVFAVFEVEDRFTHYGLVGVVLLRGNRIVQWVMSCRILGMGVEQCVMAALVTRLRSAGRHDIEADFVATDRNQPCHHLFPRNGFIASADRWTLPADRVPAPPPYVTLVEPDL